MREGSAFGFETGPVAADPTIRYIVNSQPLHDRLRQILTQVAGFSLLVMTRGSRAPALDGPLAIAADALGSTVEQFRALRVPAAADHHHLHLIEAVGAVERSIDLLTACLRSQEDDDARKALTHCLAVAAGHMRAAARLLPGFEMVDLRQSCCGGRRAPGPLICS
jgi:hypothetical protein